MATEFEGQVAIVTGAGQGIGFAMARALCHRGARVVLNDLDEELTRQAAEQIRREGGNCIGLPGDASDTAFIRQLVEEAVRHFGQLTIAIANAGITLFADFFAYTPESLRKVLDLNLGGSFFLAQAAARQMRAQGQGGRILFTSSVVGHQAHKDLAAYAMTKAGLEMLARNLVIELSPFRITVNAVAPGATLTERTLLDPAYTETWSRLTPLGKPATVDDIAQAALFLVSPAAGHITGQHLIVDGGWSAISPGPA
ncbi:MAG TPA: SDR family NAD(P)-dependent oxidoreductase [Chitinophagaceae bacterium]|nr:SDR family NAD(P)-dependent oxidoreductase [Chitinophagaceae bacterium]